MIDSKTAKTRGFGEYDPQCVFEGLTALNKGLGMENPIPYRNPQSAIITRKSIGIHFKPWEITELAKTPEGKKILRRKAEAYIGEIRRKANACVERKNIFLKRRIKRTRC